MPVLNHRGILLIFAHRGEAQEFLQRLPFQAADTEFKGFYETEERSLLLCGEGLPAAHARVSAVLNAFGETLSLVLNLGIAGSLSDSLTAGEIYPIRAVYREPEEGQAFPAFRSADPNARIDCISARRRVLTRDYAQRLAPFAPIVDRELWAIASLCAQQGIPFRSCKLISDRAGMDTPALDFKRRARQFSEQLFDFYTLHLRTVEPQP